MAKAKHAKTNAIRLLEQQKIQFEVIEYETGDGQVDGISVAEKISHPVARVFKTLVAKASAQKLFVFVIPVADELDLKAAAKVVGEKKNRHASGQGVTWLYRLCARGMLSSRHEEALSNCHRFVGPRARKYYCECRENRYANPLTAR